MRLCFYNTTQNCNHGRKKADIATKIFIFSLVKIGDALIASIPTKYGLLYHKPMKYKYGMSSPSLDFRLE